MEALFEIGLFAGKTLLITFALIAIIVTIAVLVSRLKPPREQLEVENLNERFDAFQTAISEYALDKKQLKALKKQKAKEEKSTVKDKPRLFVLEFDGDMKASAVEQLRDEVTAVIAGAKAGDEVFVKLESMGGVVHGYGLAAAQLLRLKQSQIRLTVCVDKVAASGGYMMACTADRLLAAPFAILGSIGVIAQVPNLHRFLKKHDVDYEEVTSGEFKRTVSLLGEISEKGRKKFVEQIEDTHHLFKDFVHEQRPKLDLAKVSTGEYWFGKRALELGLCDELISSDDYLFKMRETKQILQIRLESRQSLGEKIAENFLAGVERGTTGLWQKAQESSIFNK